MYGRYKKRYVSRKKFSPSRYGRYTRSRRPIAHKYFGKRRW